MHSIALAIRASETSRPESLWSNGSIGGPDQSDGRRGGSGDRFTVLASGLSVPYVRPSLGAPTSMARGAEGRKMGQRLIFPEHHCLVVRNPKAPTLRRTGSLSCRTGEFLLRREHR